MKILRMLASLPFALLTFAVGVPLWLLGVFGVFCAMTALQIQGEPIEAPTKSAASVRAMMRFFRGRCRRCDQHVSEDA